MDLKDQFKYLVGGYYGITFMDDYPLKVYVLKDIENYIKDFIEINPIDNFNYKEEAKKYEEELTEITKLQDALLVLNKINASMELVLLVKKRLKKLNQQKNNLL
ncbi:MAG: hypothetical protein IJE53_06890 [Bacilli bacterium]|nr:hypothetical protein [Bacilli bacterium]